MIKKRQIDRYNLIGFDFDGTLANINKFHNDAWVTLLEQLGINLTSKTFFCWPVSRYYKYENPQNIQNCLFENPFIQQDRLTIAKSCRKLIGDYFPNPTVPSEEDYQLIARYCCKMKDTILSNILVTAKDQDLVNCLLPGSTDLINTLISLDKKLFISSSTNSNVTSCFLEKVKLLSKFGSVIGDDCYYWNEKITKEATTVICMHIQEKNPVHTLYIGDDEVRDSLLAEGISADFALVSNNRRIRGAEYWSKNLMELQKTLLNNLVCDNHIPLNKTHSTVNISLSIPECLDNSFDYTADQIQSIHADFSDGSYYKDWIKDCTESIKKLPDDFNLPLDLHIYSRACKYIKKVIQTLSVHYSNIRNVYIQLNSLDDLQLFQRLQRLKIEGVRDKLKPAFCMNVDESLLNQLYKKELTKENLILLPKKQHYNDYVFNTSFCIFLKKYMTKERVDSRILVDRSVDLPRISLLKKLGINDFVIGGEIINSPNIEKTIQMINNI